MNNYSQRGRQELWAEYQCRSRPANIGDTIEGVRLGEVDDHIAAVSSGWSSGSRIGLYRIAELGLAVANLERVLPLIEGRDGGQYFTLLAALGRATLNDIARGDLDVETAGE